MVQEIRETGARMLGIHHVAMATTDLDATMRFYSETFDMRLLASGEWDDVPEYDAMVGLPKSTPASV